MLRKEELISVGVSTKTVRIAERRAQQSRGKSVSATDSAKAGRELIDQYESKKATMGIDHDVDTLLVARMLGATHEDLKMMQQAMTSSKAKKGRKSRPRRRTDKIMTPETWARDTCTSNHALFVYSIGVHALPPGCSMDMSGLILDGMEDKDLLRRALEMAERIAAQRPRKVVKDNYYPVRTYLGTKREFFTPSCPYDPSTMDTKRLRRVGRWPPQCFCPPPGVGISGHECMCGPNHDVVRR